MASNTPYFVVVKTSERGEVINEARVSKSYVQAILMWLKSNNPLYSGIAIDEAALSELPVDGPYKPVIIYSDEENVETNVDPVNSSLINFYYCKQ